MHTKSRWSVIAALALVLVIPTTTALATEPPGLPLQVELGDSWTFGDGASDPARTGYAGIVYESNRTEIDCLPAQVEEAADGCRHLQRVILAREGTAESPGVTTDRLIEEQLARATSLIGRRNADANPRNDVEVILLSVGGNDVSAPVLQTCLGGLTPDCISVINERVAHVNGNLEVILTSIRSAAGPEARVVITTYDNAIAHCPLGSVPGAIQLGDLVLEGYPLAGITGLNEVIRARAADHDVAVADTFGRLGASHWVGDCLHPNDAGYAVIGEIASQAVQG